MKRIIVFFAFILIALPALAVEKYIIYCNGELLEKSRIVALAEVGVMETGKNRGEVQKYLKPFNARGGTPYCAAGLYWSFLQACHQMNMPKDSIPIPKTMLANGIYNYAKKRGRKAKVKVEVDDLIVWKRRASYRGHIERIISVGTGGNVRTIAFNSSQTIKGKRLEGVFIKNRNINKPLAKMRIRGFIGFRRR